MSRFGITLRDLAALTALILFAAGGMALIADAGAHSWYDPACCSEQDCAPVPDARAPRPTAQGWRLDDGSVWPYDRARLSPDGAFHECLDGSGRRRCLYAPELGS